MYQYNAAAPTSTRRVATAVIRTPSAPSVQDIKPIAMDMQTDTMMVDQSTQTPRRPYRRRAKPSRKTSYKYRNTRPYQVYKPVNLQAGRLVGRGDYWDTLKSWGRTAQRFGQKYVPKGTFEHVGQAGWGQIGSRIGSQVANIVGFGDYQIKQNSMIDMGSAVPSFVDMSHATIITHKEYIADVVVPATPASFALRAYDINPGSSTTFPWLSSIARNFDQYEIIGMVFYFKSTSSDSAATLPLGTVIMATEYDAADANYASKQAMEQSEYSGSCKPSQDLMHPIECAPHLTAQSLLYVRTAAIANTNDLRQFDLGKFQIATTGLPAGTSGAIGELWVSYKIALVKPQYDKSIAGTDNYALTASLIAGGAPGTYFGAAATTIYPTQGVPLVGSSISGNTINLPANPRGGHYLISYVLSMPAPYTTTAISAWTYSNCAASAPGNSNIQAVVNNEVGTPNYHFHWELCILVTDNTLPASITVTAGNWTGTPVTNQANLLISALNF